MKSFNNSTPCLSCHAKSCKLSTLLVITSDSDISKTMYKIVGLKYKQVLTSVCTFNVTIINISLTSISKCCEEMIDHYR